MPVFEGFPLPTKNYYHMPNCWTDITAGMTNLAELKVVEYVLRHTWGYQEYGEMKTISIDEFMHGRKRTDGSRIDKGTGLKSDRSVRDGLSSAIEHGYLLCEIDLSDKARVKKSYALKMSTVVPAITVVESTGVVESTSGSNYRSDRQILPVYAVESTSRSEKETLERNFRKTTNNKLTPTETTPETNSIDSLIVDSQKEIVSPPPQREQLRKLTVAEKMLANLTPAGKVINDLFQQANPDLNIAGSLRNANNVEKHREACERLARSSTKPTVDEFVNQSLELLAIETEIEIENTKSGKPNKYGKGYLHSYGIHLWDLADNRSKYLYNLKSAQQRAASAAPEKKKTRQPTYEELRASKEGI